MKFETTQLEKSRNRNQCLVIFAYNQQKAGALKLKLNKAPEATKELIENAFNSNEFKAAAGETILFRNAHIANHKHLIVVGLGSGKSSESLRKAAATALRELKSVKLTSATYLLDSASVTNSNIQNYAQAIVEGAALADYSFDRYINMKPKKKKVEFQIQLATLKAATAKVKRGVQDGEIIAECVNFARSLGDTPGNLMTPTHLAKATQMKAKGTKLKVTIWDKARIKKENMNGILGVNLGGGADPRFIIMEYKGAAASKKPLTFVGKGLTFDCGGISIKPSNGMDEMKYDMCGGANVIGAMLAIAQLGLKVNVMAYVPSTENMPGPFATKPGDIFSYKNGKTVEVLNTDAEGRLILADALIYASEKKPAAIVDVATLTGAMLVGLGNIHTGIFSKDSKLAAKMQKAADHSGELVWRMPLTSEHLADIKGRHADLQNIGKNRGAGSCTAAAFLQEFIENDIPYIHCDIAGTGWNCSDRSSYNPPRSATGAMVRTFVELASQF